MVSRNPYLSPNPCEATVILEDVNVIWGLPVEGEPISGIDHSFSLVEHIERCQILLGFTPNNSDIRGGRIKISCLVDEHEKVFLKNLMTCSACNVHV
jgi:hypothetical protein